MAILNPHVKYNIWLGLLDRQNKIAYNELIPILLDNNINEQIGECQILQNAQARHYGSILLYQPINTDLFLYYRATISEDEFALYQAIHLMSIPLDKVNTIRLNDIIF